MSMMDESLALALSSNVRSWSLLIRHAERPEFAAGDFGYSVAITESGSKRASELGRALGPRLGRMITSPVPRCVQTAEAILKGDGRPISEKPVLDRLLGDPGVWISDGQLAGGAFLQLGPQGVVTRQISGELMPGMTPLAEGVERLLNLLCSGPLDDGKIDVYVSHDAVLAPLLSVLLATCDMTTIWPIFLEGMLLGHDLDGRVIIWRGTRY